MEDYGTNLIHSMIDGMFGSRGFLIVVLILLGSGSMILNALFDEKWIGSNGEKLIEKKLKRLVHSGVNGAILRNVYLPKGNGGTSEADVLFLTQKGIFVIESKNYSGWIFGSDSDYQWTAVLPNRKKYRFYNPIKQNRTHIKWLKALLDSDIPVCSLIVFSDRCQLKKVTLTDDSAVVIQRKQLIRTVRSYLDRSDDCMSGEQLAQTAQMLMQYTNIDKKAKKSHVDAIKNRYHQQ